MKYILLILFIFLFLFHVPRGLAVESTVDLFSLSMKELSKLKITTISRVSEDKDHAPGTIHVISQQMIKSRGYRNLKDILQVVPGFTVFMNELMFSAGIRGLNSNDNEKITLMINGREANGVNEPNFLNGPINLDNVERVEVIVGPSSLFQQANTLAATVNVITKTIDGAEAVLSHGNVQAIGATLVTGKRWDSETFINASLTYEKKMGFDAWDENNRPNLANRNITGRLEPSLFLTIEGKYNQWWGQIVAYESDVPALQLSGNGVNNNAFLTDKLYQFDLENSHDWMPNLKAKAGFGVAWKQQQRQHKYGFPPDGGLEQRISQVDYKAEYGLEYNGFDEHFIQAGVQITYEDNFDSFYTLDETKITLIDKNTYAVGAYFSNTWQQSDKLKLITGFRLDKNTLVNDSPYWGARLSAIYDISPNWVTKAIFNRTVRMPSPLAALNQQWGINNTNPPDFANTSPTAQDPEILTTYEWQNIFYLNETRMSATIYYQKLDDFIVWVAPHTNAGDYSGYGMELEIVQDINHEISTWFNASYINSEFKTFFDIDSGVGDIGNEHVQVNADGDIVGAPIFTANIGINYQLTEQLNFNSQLRYLTKQTSFSLIEEDFVKLNNRAYLDVAITFNNFIFNNVNLRLSGQNIFHNRKKLATQWSKSQYAPRGASYLLSIYTTF